MRNKWLRSAWIAVAAVSGAFALTPTAKAETHELNNFSMVGFTLTLGDIDALNAELADILLACQVVPVDDKNAVCFLENGTGGQIRLGLNMEGERPKLITFNPAFVGESEFPVTVNGVDSDEEWEPFEYRLDVTFSSLEIPMLVELADPRDVQHFIGREDRQNVTLDLTGFVIEPELYNSEEEFNQAQVEAGHKTVLAPNFLIPSGLFENDPSPRAQFAGKILTSELRESSTGLAHWVVLVEVMEGATINIVFDATHVTQTPKPGQLLVGEFWLSAQVPVQDEQ